MMKQFLAKVLIRLGLITRVNFISTAHVNGKPVRIPMLNGLGTGNLVTSELWMVDLVERLLPLQNGIFVDVGVNTGQTLIKLRAVSLTVPYVGFEPNPSCVYYVRELIRVNHYGSCTVVPAAISNRDGLVPLHYYAPGEADSSASIIDGFRPQKIYRTEYVAGLQWSSLGGISTQAVGIVKIDVEGAELEVLQSLQGMWDNHRPFFIVEILPAYSDGNKDRIRRQREIVLLVKQANYCLLVIDKESGELQPVEAIPVNPPMERCDYLFCPAEKLAAVQKL